VKEKASILSSTGWPRLDETYVAVLQHSLDLDTIAVWSDRQQLLGWRDDAADASHMHLLDSSGNRRAQGLQLGSTLSLGQSLARGVNAVLRFAQLRHGSGADSASAAAIFCSSPSIAASSEATLERPISRSGRVSTSNC
jgi:hypothetical protein